MTPDAVPPGAREFGSFGSEAPSGWSDAYHRRANRLARAAQVTTSPRPVIGGRSSAVTSPGGATTTAGTALTRRMAVAFRPAVLWSPSVPISWRSSV